MERISGDMLRGHLDTLILAALNAGEAHGYDILQRLNEEGRGAFAMKEGTLYPVLYRLESRGFVQARTVDDDARRKGPARRYYRLTAKGRKELDARRAAWRDFVGAVGRIVEA